MGNSQTGEKMMETKPRIAIIGGAGFIGSSLAEYLKSRFSIRVLDLKSPGLTEQIEYRCCDIQCFPMLLYNLVDVDLVIHSAVIQIPRINEQIQLGYETNIRGTENVCEAVDNKRNIRGLLLAGSWHTIGEREVNGIIDEEFGFRPDKVERRARLYVLSKIAQEAIVRFHDEMSDKIFGIIRLGTVLGEGMPEKTAANLFIQQGLGGSAITPYRQSMHRPMLYVDINDICRAFENYIDKILGGAMEKEKDSLEHIVNVYYPKPMTILELAQSIQDSITESTDRKIIPKLEIVDTHEEVLFKESDKNLMRVDINKARNFLNLECLKSPRESIRGLVHKYRKKIK